MLMKNFGHPAPKINSHHATEIRPRFVLRPRRTWPILGGVQSLPQMTLRRNAFPASPVNARLSRAPRLRIAFAMLSLSRRLMGSIIILGPAFGPLVGSAILAALNWRWIFIFLFLSGSAALASLWFVMPKNYLAANRKPLALKVISKNYLTILMNPQFILNLLVFCLAYLAVIAWIVLGPFLVIQHFQYKTSSFSLLQALIFSAMIIATWLIKYFSEKIGIHRLVKTGLVIALAASVFAIILTSIFPANLLALVLPLSSFILGSSLAFFPLQRVAIESCHEPMGARMAILSSLMSLFAVIGSFIISHAFTGSLLWFAGLLLSLSLASIFSYSFSRYLHAVNEKKRNLFK